MGNRSALKKIDAYITVEMIHPSQVCIFFTVIVNRYTNSIVLELKRNAAPYRLNVLCVNAVVCIGFTIDFF